jgi:hypothetical protein
MVCRVHEYVRESFVNICSDCYRSYRKFRLSNPCIAFHGWASPDVGTVGVHPFPHICRFDSLEERYRRELEERHLETLRGERVSIIRGVRYLELDVCPVSDFLVYFGKYIT